MGFQHYEYLVFASNVVIIDGSANFHGPVGNETVFVGFPSIDLNTTIGTAGHVTRISVPVDFVGTQFRDHSRVVPMPSNVPLFVNL